jgi:hypothetical protein
MMITFSKSKNDVPDYATSLFVISHAREYDLLAVVGVENATGLIKDWTTNSCTGNRSAYKKLKQGRQ